MRGQRMRRKKGGVDEGSTT
uniref:UORF n=1 Tax=Apis mellifera TaxID=7460 RepID=Q8T0Y5_APIME|nr:uORF [Apis mellifera]